MQDDHDTEPSSPPAPEPSSGAEPSPEPDRPTWAEAAGVSGEHVIGDERAPRLHWMLMVLGPLGLALAIVSSLWSMSQHVERSVNVQVETQWIAGEQLAIRTQIVGGDLQPLVSETEISLRYLDAEGSTHELGELETIDSGLAQGVISVPAVEPGVGELLLHYATADHSGIEPFDERVPIEVVTQRSADRGRQVVSENMLQWADDTDAQPEGVRIDLRPDGRLLAGFDNRLFVRVTDPAGRPWKPEPAPAPEPAPPVDAAPPVGAAAPPPPAKIQVLLVSGEFGDQIGDLDHPPVLYDGTVDALGLASFHGVLSSDVVRFEVRLPDPAPGTSGAKRRLRFVSHAGTVRIDASTDLAQPGDSVLITVEALSGRKPAFVDVHGPDGAWFDTLTPPLRVPQDRKWTVPERFAAAATDASGFIQFEAYQSTLRPEDTSAIARVQLAPAGVEHVDSLAPLIERQREQLSLPRVDRQFEIGRERAYLSHVEAQHRAKALDEAEVGRVRAFLIGSLEAVVHGPPQSLNTRAREDQTLATFKRKWTIGIRWFLLGGGGLFIFVMSMMVWRNQRQLEARTTDALGLVSGSPTDLGDEAFADQSLAIMQSRRQILARGVFTIALMVAALVLTLAMLESLVWEY